jgi:hypothetical protein
MEPEIEFKYLIRHRILGALYDEYTRKRPHDLLRKSARKPLDHSNMYKSELIKVLGITEAEFDKYHTALHHEGENQLLCEPDENGNTIIGLHEAGLHAFTDEYWLHKGQREAYEWQRLKMEAKNHFYQKWSFWLGVVIGTVISLTGVLIAMYKK